MSAPSKASPVSAYELAGAFAGAFHGTRRLEGKGHDLCTVVHRRDPSQETMVVGVERRFGGDSRSGSRGASDGDDVARLSMATALVVDHPGIGDRVVTVAAEIAYDSHTWRPCELTVDGHLKAGYEGKFKGKWIAYCLTPILIIYVLADIFARPCPIELRRCQLDEGDLQDAVDS